MLAYVAESAASAPPPRPGPPLIPPPRASRLLGAGSEEPRRPAPGVPADALEEDDFAAPFEAGSTPPGAADEDGPPLEEIEGQMRAELAARDAAAPAPAAKPKARPAAGDDEDDPPGAKTALPELDDLVARIPEAVRETLDELFRARFVAVKKLPKRCFAPASSKSAAGKN